MLRLSEEDSRNLMDIQEIHKEATEREFGSAFQPPTLLFEDVIKVFSTLQAPASTISGIVLGSVVCNCKQKFCCRSDMLK